MTRRAKLGLVIGLVALLIGVAAYRHRGDAAARHALNLKAEALKVTLDQRFAVGASRGDVVDFLRQQPTDRRIEGESDYFFSVGRAPSGLWYCGLMDVGVWSRFRDAQLERTEVGGWSDDCL